MKKKECKPTEHDFEYQLMQNNLNAGLDMALPEVVTKRILFCKKCGKIKKIKFPSK